jgi:copper(I)-binding protein
MIITLVVALFLSPANASVAPATAPIQIRDAYSRPANDIGAVFLTIVNVGNTADTIDKARSEIASDTEVHESYDTGNGSAMRHVSRLPIAAGQSVSFHTGGYHVMLIGLKLELRAGDRFTIGLHFEHAGWIDVPVIVRSF